MSHMTGKTQFLHFANLAIEDLFLRGWECGWLAMGESLHCCLDSRLEQYFGSHLRHDLNNKGVAFCPVAVHAQHAVEARA